MILDKKDTVLLPTSYFGPVEYFYYLHKFDNIIIEQHETWLKQTYRNRTIIAADKGTIPLIVPINRVNGTHTKTIDITIPYREKWHIKHWRAIETVYQNSPYFLYYSDEIKDILFSQEKNIVLLNEKLTKVICRLIDIDINLSYTSDFKKTIPETVLDLRYHISPKLPPTLTQFPEYIQVFSDRQPFIPNTGILDLLFCLGPESKSYLEDLAQNQ